MKHKTFAIVIMICCSNFTAHAGNLTDAHNWIKENRPNVLTWDNFNSALVKTQQGKVDSIGVVYGNFYSDKYVDAALLSVQKNHLTFEILRCNPYCSLTFTKDVESGVAGIRYVRDGITYLRLIKKGNRIETSPAIENEDKHIKLKHDAIEMNTFEKAAMVWYWNSEEKKWDTVSTAD